MQCMRTGKVRSFGCQTSGITGGAGISNEWGQLALALLFLPLSSVRVGSQFLPNLQEEACYRGDRRSAKRIPSRAAIQSLLEAAPVRTLLAEI